MLRIERVARSPWAWALGATALVVGVGALVSRKGSGAGAPSAGLTYVTARPAPLVPGTTYYARADVSFPLSLFVTTDAVSTKLASLGFSNILVTTDASALPASWPAGEREGNLFVEATYSGQATTMAVPSQVASVWT